MICTFTPNPSIDATLSLERLTPGHVHPIGTGTRQAGGKGINVAHALSKAGLDVVAVAPSTGNDDFLALAEATRVPLRTVTVPGQIRTNTTITEADGRTTKLNEPGPHLDVAAVKALEDRLIDATSSPSTVILAGSLPPGAPADWYPLLVATLKRRHPGITVAVDTSREPLLALASVLRAGAGVESGPPAAPDIIKPNAYELGDLVGKNGGEFEYRAAHGDLAPVVEASRELLRLGVKEVLTTLGGSGACLVTAGGAWHATCPPCTVVSTVGAGDSALAGYLVGRNAGAPAPEALKRATAYGTAAASRPGTTVPAPDEINLTGTRVSQI